MGNWQHGLFGCFRNSYVCLLTYFAPCYVVGKVAEKVDESFRLHACLTFVPIVNVLFRSKVRGIIRERRGIEGSHGKDLCLHCFCGCCALIQEALEVEAIAPRTSIVQPEQQMIQRQ